MEIINTTPEDIDLVGWLFEQAIAYQRRHGYPAWQGYDRQALLAEIIHHRQYKLTRGQDVLAIFSILYSDPATWAEWDTGSALFLHRIITHPRFKGQRVFEKVRDWAIQKAKAEALDYIRIDTWTDNPTIIDFYKSYGFRVVAERVTSDSPDLPAQNRNLRVTLLQLPIAGSADHD